MKHRCGRVDLNFLRISSTRKKQFLRHLGARSLSFEIAAEYSNGNDFTTRADNDKQVLDNTRLIAIIPPSFQMRLTAKSLMNMRQKTQSQPPPRSHQTRQARKQTKTTQT
jgi:hypothetical protein